MEIITLLITKMPEYATVGLLALCAIQLNAIKLELCGVKRRVEKLEKELA